MGRSRWAKVGLIGMPPKQEHKNVEKAVCSGFKQMRWLHPVTMALRHCDMYKSSEGSQQCRNVTDRAAFMNKEGVTLLAFGLYAKGFILNRYGIQN